MRREKWNGRKSHTALFSASTALAFFLMATFPIASLAQQAPLQPGQKSFSSPQEATQALVMAVKNNDRKAMSEILGPDASRIVSSGDDVADAQERANFLQKYQQMHRLVREPDRTTTLYIGAENWPTPIPLVNKGNSWYFDTAAGKKEILYRRVGQNEISTIFVCRELVATQKKYFKTQNHEYAQKIFSDDGRHNGLYWKVANGEPQSPIGPLVAAAVAEGYAQNQNGAPSPYHGYYFHILVGQGATAPGGAKSYLVAGKMTRGFAFIAYPAEYRSSGVMTFIVDQDGVVYQKDLGKETDVVGKAMKEYNPDATWHKAADDQQE